MPITASFNTTQEIGLPQNIVLNDTSTGSDVTATTRRVYVKNAANQYLTEDYTVSDTAAYTEFPLADGSQIILQNILSVDSALYITLTYNASDGSVVATVTMLKGFTLYNESFYYTLTQSQAMQNQPPPMIMQDSNYYTNKGILRTEIDAGNNAIAYGSDIQSAQECYDRASYMVANQNEFF